jgi:hypothetical protein
MGSSTTLSVRTVALLLFLVTLGVAGFSLRTCRQLGPFGGLTDEWLELGVNLALHGTLGLGNEPWTLRAPGYPAFIALPLLGTQPPPVVTIAYLMRSEPLVYAEQSLVLAATTTLLFVWLAAWLRRSLAFASALVFGLNPLSVSYVGLLHYSLLHLLGLVGGMWALQRAAATKHPLHLLAAGALWGLVTLVRPVSLPLPAFVFLILLCQVECDWRCALRSALTFALGMAIVIAPWTARNYAVSGRFVPVNLQGGFAFWAASVKPLPLDPDHYLWYEIDQERMQIYRRVTGQSTYELETFVRFLPELESEYRREGLSSLRRQPQVYLRNVVRSLYTLATGTSTVFPRVFAYLQERPGLVQPWWFRRGQPQPFDREALGVALRALFGALTVLSVAGLVVAGLGRDRSMAAPALVAGCLALVHGLTHMDLMYYYLRLPFLCVFAFYALDRFSPSRGGATARERLATVAGFGLVGASALLTVWML